MALTLISHPLCPYVQRAAIAMLEKRVPFERRTVDLAAKPDWFLALSPLGKTPVLVAEGQPIFESAVILEYLEETQLHPLHPADPLARARHRGWIEVASAILNDIAGLYGAPDQAAFARKAADLRARFVRVEDALDAGPWFAGARFSLVDAAFAPVFRYTDAFDRAGGFGLLDGLTRTGAWRAALAARPSVRGAVAPDYTERLNAFLAARSGPMGQAMRDAAPA
jgi:glutathione S-transferase